MVFDNSPVWGAGPFPTPTAKPRLIAWCRSQGCETVGLCVSVAVGRRMADLLWLAWVGSQGPELGGGCFRHFSAALFLSFPLPFWLAPQGSVCRASTVHAMNAK